MSYFAIISSMNKLDSDAQTFLSTAGITDQATVQAINNLVKDLKTNLLWSKFVSLYPFAGTTSTTQRFNLINPTVRNLTFQGGATYNASGYLPNGTNGYANTSTNPNTITQNSVHLAIYSRTNSATNTQEIGCNSTTPVYLNMQLNNISNNFVMSMNSGLASNTFANGNGTGFYLGTRTASNAVAAYKNGVSLGTGTTASTGRPNVNLLIAALLNNTTVQNFSAKNIAFASIGTSFTAAEALTYYNIVQTYQIAMGRAIGTQTVSDSDAQAFINAANIQDQIQATAINTLVLDMKAQGLWTKCIAIYPMVGGTAATHIYNLKNPSQYNLTFSGTWTHSITGALPNGVNAYADTGINGSTVLTQNNTHFSFYSRSNTAAGAKASIGAYNNTTAPNEILSLSLKNTSGNAGAFNTSQATGQPALAANANSQGFYINNKTSSAIGGLSIVKNGTVLASNTATITINNYPNRNIFIGASSITTGTAFQYDDKQCAFASIGSGLTVADYTAYNTIITNFQTTLERNV